MQKKTPRFSVLICTVGKQDLVSGAIQSILDQSYSDFEIIVTDTSGGSQIRSLVTSFKDERIEFFEVPGLDPTISWEFAYEQSKGQFVLWYDDDNRLVPWALEHFDHLIRKEGADIVSGNHVYYFGEGNRHDPEEKNMMVALFPFSLNSRQYEPSTLLRAVYDFSMGKPTMPARWHSAATFVSRVICEQARARVGYVIAPNMYGNFTFHPIIFSFALAPVYDDRPLCVIGKFGSSITQQWSNLFVHERRSTALPFRFSGLTERTLGNTTAECYLRVRNDIPEHTQYPFNWEKVYRRYSDELLFLHIPIKRHVYAWYGLWLETGRITGRSRNMLRMQILKQFIQSIALHILRLVSLWDAVRRRLRKTSFRNENRKSVSLSHYEITSIDSCARLLDEVMKKEWDIGIKDR